MPNQLLKPAAAAAALLLLMAQLCQPPVLAEEVNANLAMSQSQPGTVAIAAPASKASTAIPQTIEAPSPPIKETDGSASAKPNAVAASITPAGLSGNATDADVPIIDNDEEKVTAEYKWEEIPDAEGKTHIQAGAKFPVCLVTTHTSKNAKVGDPVEGKLNIDIKIGGHTVATRGATVIGHVISVAPARRMLVAELCPKRWMRAAGALGIQFDEILFNDQHIPLVAVPASASRVVNNVYEGRVLGVNQDGQLASPLSIQLKHQALHLAIRAGASAGGVFSFGAVPVAYGVLGAISPSFAFMQPVGKNVRHRRLKGFTMGVVSGLPGGFLISDTIIRGPEAVVKPGDIYLAQFKQDFTGEPATEAQLLPNVKTKVHGEVVP